MGWAVNDRKCANEYVNESSGAEICRFVILEILEGSGGPPRMAGSGQKTLPLCRDWLAGTTEGPGGVEWPSLSAVMGW